MRPTMRQRNICAALPHAQEWITSPAPPLPPAISTNLWPSAPRRERHYWKIWSNKAPRLRIGESTNDYRSKGLGRRLLDTLVETVRAESVPALSLSVSPLNFARQLYESAGFRKVGESGTSWTLLLSLSPPRCTPTDTMRCSADGIALPLQSGAPRG